MPTRVLSAKLVERIRAPERGQIEVFDSTLPGFGLRVSKGGRKAWVLLYRSLGRKRRLTLGAYPALSLGAARAEARRLIQSIQTGSDPALEKQQKRATQPATFGELSAEYIERYAKVRKRSWKNDETNLRRHFLPAWRDRPVTSIRRADVVALIEESETRGQLHLARQLLATVRKLFGWAVEKALVDHNPVAGVRTETKPQDRSRTLSLEEMRQIWAVWDEIGGAWGAYFKILLLTAQRRSEVSHMRWDQISDDVWTIPAEANKSGRLHLVPVPTEVRGILDSLPRTTSPYVFPARTVRDAAGTDNPISGFSAAVRKVNAALPQPFDWRIHDLRRTATSMMARLRFPPHVLSAVLNHAPQSTMKGVLSVYNRYEYLAEKREALQAWAAYVREQVAGYAIGESWPEGEIASTSG